MKEITKITGTLVYVCVPKPVKAYVKKGEAEKPDEWKAGVVVTDEDFVDEFEAYAASLDTQVSVKKVKVEEFEEIYKCPVPEGADKKVWVITLRKSTELGKTGKPVPDLYKPKVFEKVGSTLVDVTNSKLPVNGSLGSISIDRFDRNNGTASLYLKNVLVTNMIEYVAQESDYNPGDEFSDEGSAAPAPAKAEKPAPAKAPKAKSAAETADEEDMPF